MDSVTQFALGAAVGHAVLGKHVGRRALVWGALLGTLPDLDIVIPMADPVDAFTRHRSWTHSVFVVTLAAPLFAWLARRIHPATREHGRGWLALVLLVFWTHVLLDACTVYGTQLLWPLPFAPASWSLIFVIDPVYTLPLLVGIVGAWFGRARWNRVGLALSTAYLLWCGAAKWHVESVVHGQLVTEGRADALVLTTPSPFNSLLWRVVVMGERSYSEGYYSLVADDAVTLTEYPSEVALLEPIAEHPPVARLRWFTDGLYGVRRAGDNVVVSDLRMGSEPDYVFRFVVGRAIAGRIEPVPARRDETALDYSALSRVWARIWDSTVAL